MTGRRYPSASAAWLRELSLGAVVGISTQINPAISWGEVYRVKGDRVTVRFPFRNPVAYFTFSRTNPPKATGIWNPGKDRRRLSKEMNQQYLSQVNLSSLTTEELGVIRDFVDRVILEHRDGR